ncbi:uncharacterized protein [Montipora capricornis]|uniref:uncharacterized protein n=1 Tax=Montipora capricornis TaxID=246305 RepID=UPI0035F19CFB
MALKSNIHCCVPLCTQRGRVGPKGEQIGFFKFPDEEEMKKRWIHAIRRDVGRFFRISGASKVCSLHFKLSDISKGLGGRMSLKTSAVPSIFAWKQTSPRKQPPPTERPYQQKRKDRPKSVPEKECFSVSSEPKILLSKTPEAVNDIPETGTNETITLGAASTSLDEMPSTEKDLFNNETLKQLRLLENKCADLEKAVSELEDKNEALQSNVFSLSRFTSDEAMLFYTGFPNYRVFLASFEYLDPGDNGENVRYWLSCDNEIPSEHYETPAQLGVKRGRPRSLKPQEEFFLTLCRLRQGFAETHLSHLFNVSQATISRIIISWINFMYLRFGVVNIWPSREAINTTMPEDFRKAYPSTRVIIDCTEVKCAMPSSLLLNSELFSTYKNHTTLKGLVGISPSGAITFISQLYTGSMSDREIVERSGILDLPFTEGDSVMADKGFTISDILPLGVSLNIPPFLGTSTQMPPEDVVRTQEIARLRIHVERAINKIKNFHIWDSVIPLNLFGVANQMWSVCAFLCNIQDHILTS